MLQQAAHCVQHKVQGVLNNVRDAAGKLCMRSLHRHNAPLAMATCGAKGSPINIAQMVACVGQQSVFGQRPGNGFDGRTIPHFPRCGIVFALRRMLATPWCLLQLYGIVCSVLREAAMG